MNANDNKLMITGRIDIKSYHYEQLPDSWDKMNDVSKLDTLQSLDPVESQTDFNTTTIGMHEYFPANLDPTQSVDKSASHLAIGDNDTSPSSSDTSLNNEIFRKSVTDHAQTENELLCSTFIDSGEANGNTFREVGLFAGTNTSDTMWNHSTISDIVKDSSRTITIDVTLTFNAA